MLESKLKTGEKLMLVCQGSIVRVTNSNAVHDYYDLEAPGDACNIDLRRNGFIEITFSDGCEKDGSKKWLYKVNKRERSLVPYQACR